MTRALIRGSLLIACALASSVATAQDVSLKDAINCRDFKHNSDGSWYAEAASLNYGPGKKQQMNFFGTTIKKPAVKAGEPDIWSLLNEKCGTTR